MNVKLLLFTIIKVQNCFSVVLLNLYEVLPLPTSGDNWHRFQETLYYINMWFIIILFPFPKEDDIWRNTLMDIFGQLKNAEHYIWLHTTANHPPTTNPPTHHRELSNKDDIYHASSILTNFTTIPGKLNKMFIDMFLWMSSSSKQETDLHAAHVDVTKCFLKTLSVATRLWKGQHLQESSERTDH